MDILGKKFQFSSRVAELISSAYGPLCGLIPEAGLISRSLFEPRLYVSGGQLCGIHRLLGRDEPKPGSYHIGGSGLALGEALIKTVAEALERYSQMIAARGSRLPARFLSESEMNREGLLVAAPPGALNLFVDSQLKTKDFPFSKYDESTPIGWIRGVSLITGKEVWAPAQMVLLGYNVRSDLGEPRFAPAVTTGTATHSSFELAVSSAILELIQIDTAMGNWYGQKPTAHRIVSSSRTELIDEIISKYGPRQGELSFFWLSSPDLAGLITACVYRGDSYPTLAVGLGAAFSLQESMLKAFFELAGVIQLAKFVGLYSPEALSSLPRPIYDLDENVVQYAAGANSEHFSSRFSLRSPISASDVPQADQSLDSLAKIKYLLDAFSRTDKEILIFDLTTAEGDQLGLYTARVWSPDILALSIPSAPAKAHPRYRIYGGFGEDVYHPYP